MDPDSCPVRMCAARAPTALEIVCSYCWRARPYLNAGLCGPDMAIACYTEGLPIATKSAPTNRTISPKELQKFTAPVP
jgi:hypothetical protein